MKQVVPPRRSRPRSGGRSLARLRPAAL